LLPGLDRPLRPRTAVRLHIGTSDMPGHLLLPDLAPLKPGSETYVQVQLQNAVVAAPHDVCVVRMLSPARTLGGGTVIGTEPEKMRRTRGTWVEHCAEQERAFRDPASAVAYVVARARTALDAATVAKRCLLSPETAAAGLKSLAAKGDAIALEGNRFAHGNAIREVRMRIEAALGALHDRSPLSLGFPRKELMPRLQDDRPLVEHALADLLREGRVRQNSAGYQLASRTPALDPEQEKVAVALRQIYRSKGFQSPRPDELTGLTGAPEPRVQAVLAHLCQTGELVRMDDRVVLHRDFVELSKQKILEHLARRDSLEPGQIKDALGTTRKYVIPILEYWDAQRLTRRVGNARVLKK
jgi:selenocysteine-specific elongation factor